MAGECRDRLGVEVILNSTKPSPHCPHGPTLLFEKFFAEKQSSARFFACSACRDRKHCNFFQWENEKVSVARQKAREESNKLQRPVHSHKHLRHRLKQFKKLPESERKFCQTCDQLLLPDEWTTHQGHLLVDQVTAAQLRSPSCLLKPLENSKTNAQYLFAEKASTFIVDTIQSVGGQNVLCVGCPRLHETVQMGKLTTKCPLDSLLLDIDHRYMQYYNDQEMCQYNMFNHHFFTGDKSKAEYMEFLKRDKMVIVIDPPFGGLVDALAANVRNIVDDWKMLDCDRAEEYLPILWIFPYFMEPRITACMPELVMLDYKVEYDNHPLYKHKHAAQKRGSPVRIFTNLPPAQVKLPKEDGYKFCKVCQRFSAAENIHCLKCGTCPSKDGQTYRHCDECKRCVKPSRVHCATCQQCVKQDHKCGKLPANSGCYACGSSDHKRRQCPEILGKDSAKRKQREWQSKHGRLKKKRKKNNS